MKIIISTIKSALCLVIMMSSLAWNSATVMGCIPSYMTGRIFCNYAAANNLEELKKYLTSFNADNNNAYGIDVNWADPEDNNYTALHYAAKNGHLPIVEELIKYPGINLQAKTPAGQTALDLAIQANHQDVATAIRDKIEALEQSSGLRRW